MTLLVLQTNISNHYGILLLIVGLFIRYQIGRHRFNRRSLTGVQIFSSYLKGILTTVVDKLFNLLGALFIIGGLIGVVILL